MFEQFKVYIIVTISALFASISIYAYILSVRLDTANAQLAIVNNDSAQQKIKVVEVEKKVEVIKWKTKERIQYVYQYQYDNNKSDCDNAIDLLRSNF